jgi:hypothetical protein
MLLEDAGVTRRWEAPEDEDRVVRGRRRVLLQAEGGDKARRRREGRGESEADVMSTTKEQCVIQLRTPRLRKPPCTTCTGCEGIDGNNKANGDQDDDVRAWTMLGTEEENDVDRSQCVCPSSRCLKLSYDYHTCMYSTRNAGNPYGTRYVYMQHR